MFLKIAQEKLQTPLCKNLVVALNLFSNFLSLSLSSLLELKFIQNSKFRREKKIKSNLKL